MILSGCFWLANWNILLLLIIIMIIIIIIIIIITHTLNRPFSPVITAGQLNGQLKLCSRSACIII